MALVSMFGCMYAADDTQAEMTALNSDQAALKGLAARRLNSLMEAYMEGKFAASKNEGCLKYDDYETRASHEENWAFEDTVKDINDQLLVVYGPISYAIDGWTPLNFHIMLAHCKGKEGKISRLQRLQEADKAHIQSLRLYDFLKCMNMDLPDAVLQELQKIADNKELSDLDKDDAARKIMIPLEETAKEIKANRLALAKAVRAGDIAQVLETCKNPLHIKFVSLNVAIAKMITDIEAGEDNVLLNNHSRAQQGCIIS